MSAALQRSPTVMRVRRRLETRRALLGLLVAAAACGWSGLSAEQHATVDSWLLCDDCANGELNAVQALGSAAIRRLEAALVNGPPADRRNIMRSKIEQRYQSLGSGASVSQGDYVNELLSNYVAMYHRRAAIALGAIGGDAARAALDRALEPGHVNTYRADVAREIRFIRFGMTAPLFAGSLEPTDVGVGDSVRVSAPPAGSFSGDERANIDDAPFAPDSVLVGPVTVQAFHFLAAGEIGRHHVAISRVTSPQDTQYAPLTIRSLVDRNDRASANCATYGCLVDS
ncbi:MAG: hypothetical protein AB1762_10530, partial [Gemmatimonadota bacterium]